MSSSERLRRYLTSERDECSDIEFTERLAELEEWNEIAGGPRLEADVGVLAALANETRYRIVRILHVADEELCVCEFSPLLDVSDSAVSHALAQLTDAGLLVRRKDGKWRKYRATPIANAMLVTLDGSRTL